jgi:acyl-ACP thioesterase
MREDEKYSHRYSLTAADIDTRYRMTPGAVLLYYQDSWARFMACLQLAAFDVVKINRIWVITEFNAWFEEQTALWSDEIEVSVWNSETSTLRLYSEFRMCRNDGVEVAHGYGCWTLLDTEAHRLAPLTPITPQLPVLAEMTSESHRKRHFPTDGTLQQQIEHRVNPINLDFNGHVNNRTYLGIAMQSADEAFMDAHAVSSLSIHWLKETFLGDTLMCRQYRQTCDDGDEVCRYLHTISRGDGQVAAQVYSEWVPRREQTDVSTHAKRD